MNTHPVRLSVYGILTDTNNHILMQKRSNTAYANGCWSFAGGHVEPGESILAAIRRELFEELAVVVTPEHCHFQLTLIRKPQDEHRYVNFFYVINNWRGTPVISDGKASELCFFSRTALPNPTLPYIQEAIHLIDRGIQFHESIY